MKRALSTATIHQLLGAAVLGGLVLLLAFGYRAKLPNQPDEGYLLEARFKSTDGISVGSEILMAGLPVGMVVDQQLDTATNLAILTMKIEEQVEIPVDSAAKIVSNGIAGGKYIKITPGGDIDLLQNGDQFDYVQDSVIFEELLEKVITAAEQKRLAAQAEKQAAQTTISDEAAAPAQEE